MSSTFNLREPKNVSNLINTDKINLHNIICCIFVFCFCIKHYVGEQCHEKESIVDHAGDADAVQ